jgi:hypothetical protein
MKSCTMADSATCRGVAGDLWGDYECRDWSGLAIGGKALSKGPVCDFGLGTPCSIFSPQSNLKCDSLGGQGNPTKMSCRSPVTGQNLSDPYDPEGACYDDTASGATFRTLKDAGVVPTPDAGAPAADVGSGG